MDLRALLEGDSDSFDDEMEEAVQPAAAECMAAAEAAEAEPGELPAACCTDDGAAAPSAAKPAGGLRAAAAAAAAKAGRRRFSPEVRAVAGRIAAELGEKKLYLLLCLVDKFGRGACERVLGEAAAAERGGGVATADGARRRSPGGAFLHLLSRAVPTGEYRAVVAEAEAARRAGLAGGRGAGGAGAAAAPAPAAAGAGADAGGGRKKKRKGRGAGGGGGAAGPAGGGARQPLHPPPVPAPAPAAPGGG